MGNRPVIVGVDGSEHSLKAAEYAARLASSRSLPLHLVHGYLHPLGFGAAPIDPYAMVLPEPPDRGEQMLAEAVARLRAAFPRLDASGRQVAGGAAAALVAESDGAELIVVGSRGLGGFTGLLLGSVSAQVAAHARGPVVVVRPESAESTGGCVLVGVDGSEAGVPAIEFAFAEAAARGVPLRAVHVYWARAIDSILEPDADPDEHAVERAAALVADAVDPAAARYPQVTVERRLIHSMNPEYNLIEQSAEAALAVVGSRGRGGFTGLLLGSVSQALVHHAACPVAVVHPRG